MRSRSCTFYFKATYWIPIDVGNFPSSGNLTDMIKRHDFCKFRLIFSYRPRRLHWFVHGCQTSSILVIYLHMKIMPLLIWRTGLVSIKRRIYSTPCNRRDNQWPYKSKALLEIP
jgi:hypothetical protein